MAKLSDLIDLGLLVSRPAAGIAGRLYQATDTAPPTVYRDNGVSWDTWASVGSAAIADIDDLPTATLTTTLVLQPDGAGGVHWAVPAGGGGGGTPATNAAALIYAYLSFR